MKKLEIGPSPTRGTPDGLSKLTWNTMDSHETADIRCIWGEEPIPVSSNHYDWIHASHVLEHVPWWNIDKALSEVYRVLVPDGRFTVWVPDGLKIIEMALTSPEKVIENEQGWTCGGLNPDGDLWTYVNARIFWGARRGELGACQHFHKSLFGKSVLQSYLQKAGFRNIAEIQRNLSVEPGHGWMEIGMECYK